MQQMVLGKYRTCQQRVPAIGVLTNGAAVTAFSITQDVDGNALPAGLKIKSMTIAHVDVNDATITSISEVCLYNRLVRAAKDKIAEDAWSDFTAATYHKFDTTERLYMNLDRVGAIHGTARVKAAATDAALYVTIDFEVL